LFSLITGEDAGGTWSRLTGTGGTLRQQVLLYRQALLPVRLNIYFQQHLHVLQMRASTVNVNNQPDAELMVIRQFVKAVYHQLTCLV
jgi:hypothetical protein